MIPELWILITAIVFTVFGYSIGMGGKRRIVELAISATIDTLIKDGFLKTRGAGNDMEILKVNDKTD